MSKKRRNKKSYIPKPQHNLAVMSKQIEKLNEDIQEHKNILESIINSHERHIEFLSNFANHDLKNNIQSFDAILYNISTKNITEDTITSLRTALDVLRGTITNFMDLIPISKNERFEIKSLIHAAIALSRNDIHQYGITLKQELSGNTRYANLPFQTLLQILHNLIINSMNALKETNAREILIKLSYIGDTCCISVLDNGLKIETNIQDKIFEHGFSTTNGTGIGLFHAKYCLGKMGGNIHVNLMPNNFHTKEFFINFPLSNIPI